MLPARNEHELERTNLFANKSTPDTEYIPIFFPDAEYKWWHCPNAIRSFAGNITVGPDENDGKFRIINPFRGNITKTVECANDNYRKLLLPDAKGTQFSYDRIYKKATTDWEYIIVTQSEEIICILNQSGYMVARIHDPNFVIIEPVLDGHCAVMMGYNKSTSTKCCRIYDITTGAYKEFPFEYGSFKIKFIPGGVFIIADSNIGISIYEKSTTGKYLLQFPMPRMMDGVKICDVAGGHLIIGDHSRKICVFDLHDNRLLKTFKTEEQIHSDAALYFIYEMKLREFLKNNEVSDSRSLRFSRFN